MNDKIKELRHDSTKAKDFFMEQLAFKIGPVDLKNLMEEEHVTIVDVRNAADYEISHIAGAVSIPKDELADNLNKLNKESVTVVYSYNQQCNLCIKAALILADYEYPCVYLEGGFKTWKEDFRFAST